MASAAALPAAAAVAAPVSAEDVQQALFAPLTLVQRLLDAHCAAKHACPRTPLSPAEVTSLHAHCAASNWGVSDALQRILGLQFPRSSAQCLLSRIPSLNSLSPARRFDVSHLRPGQLVRFRGMLQETFEPEFYAGIIQAQEGEHKGEEQKKEQPFTTSNIRTCKYRDLLDVSTTGNEDHECMLERLAINVVPVPGESEWVQQAQGKVERRAPHAAANGDAADAAPSAVSAKKKRGLESEGTAAPAADADAMSDEAAPAASTSASADGAAAATPQKKGKSDAAAAPASGAALPEDRGLEVIVTVYDSLARSDAAASSSAVAPASAHEARAPLRVGDMVEFIGVLSVAPDLKAELECDSMDDGMLGVDQWNARRSQALRMHALTAIRMEPGFPLLANPNMDAALFDTQRQQLLAQLPAIRSSLLAHLTATLGGDALAGELLLLFLLQRVHNRQSSLAGNGSLIGKLVLNLIAPLPPADRADAATALGQRVQQVLENIMPRVKRVEVNIDSLNADQWQPKKDYESDSLESNRLHLASPSLLLLDETSLSPGRLLEQGVRNLQVLSKLLAQGTLEYDFQYQSLDFPVEYATLLLSAGSKTLLSQDGQAAVDVAIKVQPQGGAEALYAAHSQPSAAPSEEQLNQWRTYLLINRQQEFSLAPSMGKPVEELFVSLRQKRPTVTNEGTLHLLLNLARLYSLSHGETELNSHARWAEVTELFERMYQRTQA